MAIAHANESCRHYVLFPICITSVKVKKSAYSDLCIVFPNLSSDPARFFRVGIPKVEDDKLLYIAELEKGMTAIHNAGLVHMDFYPSNIMWFKNSKENRIEIKIIDCNDTNDKVRV